MNRLALGALTLLGTMCVAACDQAGNEHHILAATAAAPEVRQEFSMPVHATATAQLSGCNSAQGVSVSLDGQLALAGLGARLTFYNNEKGTQGATIVAQGQAGVIPAGTTISIPRQPSATDVRGNPSVFLQLVDGSDRPVTSEAALGSCGGSLVSLTSDFTLPAAARATVTSCEHSPGPNIRLSGELAIEAGVAAKVTLRGDSTQTVGSATSGILRVVIVPARGTIQFANQPVNGGAGGNPWIYLKFWSASGAAIGQECLIGRCQQLSQA